MGEMKEHRMEEGMRAYQELSKEELLALKAELEKKYEDAKGKGLKLDMSRGKPSVAQLDMGMDIFDVLNSQSDMTSMEGVDVRNYGVLDGLADDGGHHGDKGGEHNRVRQRKPECDVRRRLQRNDPRCHGMHAVVQVRQGEVPLPGPRL